MRILLAEDEEKLARHIQRGLEEAAYAVDVASDGEEALWLASNHPYDAIVMDVMMPGRDGFSVVRRLRHDGIEAPVLFLTARSEVEDRIRGLDAGADDYLTKPFSMEELLARLRALLRRGKTGASQHLKVEDLELDLRAHVAHRNGKVIELTNREFALLQFLMLHSPAPVAKTAIVEHVWNQHFDSGTNLVNVYINHLRSKIDTEGLPPLLHTVRGVGFALRPANSISTQP